MSAEIPGGLAAFGLDWKIFLAQLLNFGLVVLVLWRWAFRPITQRLLERQEKIAAGLQQAKHIEERVERLEQERTDILRQARVQAEHMGREAAEAAEVYRKDMKEKTKQEVALLVTQGKTALAAEQDRLLRDARQDIVRLSVEIARKVLQDRMDEKTSLALAQKTLEKL